MPVENVYLTVKGHEKISVDLKKLKEVERPRVIKAIEEARSHGDLSENAEYHAAKERQGLLEAQIVKLQDVLARAQVINPATLSGDRIVFGATVMLLDVDRNEKVTYQIVGEEESDISSGKLSVKSPIGRALIGKYEGDEVEVKTPAGLRHYEVLNLKFE
jgi:transcription elongation factor GreA